MPDLSEGSSHDANADGQPDYRDPTVACSNVYPGQEWRDIEQAKTVHAVSCRDTVANGNDACHPGEKMSPEEYTLKYDSCAASMNRFHGNVGDIYTVHCPGGCDQDEASIVYGPGNGDDSESCDQFNEGTKFLDHSSICRAAIAKGVLFGGPGLVVIRLVEPLASYPSCSSMPRNESFDVVGHHAHYSRRHPISFSHSIERPHSAKTVNGEFWDWPQWQEADNSSNVARFGPAAECCNYTARKEDTEWTPEGGGCCAIQRFRQKWIPKLRQQKCPDHGCYRRGVFGSSWGIGNFWIGVRAFEILNHTYQGGCSIYTNQSQCNRQPHCAFDAACGCIAKNGTCQAPCGTQNSMSDSNCNVKGKLQGGGAGGLSGLSWGSWDPLTGVPRIGCVDTVARAEYTRYKDEGDGQVYISPVNRFYGSTVFAPRGKGLSQPGYLPKQEADALCTSSSGASHSHDDEDAEVADKGQGCPDPCAYTCCNCGQSYTVQCPDNCFQSAGSVYSFDAYGSTESSGLRGPFHDSSSICRAAILAGVGTNDDSFYVTFKIVEPLSKYESPSGGQIEFKNWDRVGNPDYEAYVSDKCCQGGWPPKLGKETNDVLKWRAGFKNEWQNIRAFVFEECEDDEGGEVCIDRCIGDPDKASVIIKMLRNETSFEAGSAPASFTVGLSKKPESNVIVVIRTEPSELSQDTPEKLIFTPYNWSEPQSVLVSAVICDPSTAVPPVSEVSVATSSTDLLFHELDVNPVSIGILQGEVCPMLEIPQNAVVTKSNYLDTYSNFVFIINYYCRRYYDYREIDPVRAQAYLDMCGASDCQQIRETGCRYTDGNGFCYGACGTYFCEQTPWDSRCHANVLALHGQCQEDRTNAASLNGSQPTRPSCGREVGSSCTIQCGYGLAPLQPVTISCSATTRTWNATVPICDSCALGYYYGDVSKSFCKKCSDGPCHVGYYRGKACSVTEDSECMPCTGKPADSIYISAGNPDSQDACAWSCRSGFYKETVATDSGCDTCSQLYAAATAGGEVASCISGMKNNKGPCNDAQSELRDLGWKGYYETRCKAEGGSNGHRVRCAAYCGCACKASGAGDCSEFKRPTAQCTKCSSSTCPPGEFRQACSENHDGKCTRCSQPKPNHSHWTTPGIPYDNDNCQWGCDDGYFLQLGKCTPEVMPAVIVQSPQCAISNNSCFGEHGGSVQISLKLSTHPASDVVIRLGHDNQLNVSAPSVRISSSNWNTFTLVTVRAVDDFIHEDSPHFGILNFEAVSSDSEYNFLPVNAIAFGILDNDCSQLISPAHGSLEECKNSHGNTCRY